MESNANNHFNVKRVKILILGLSGAGKTSLVNLFYVWSQQWKLDDLKFKDKVLIKTKYFDGDSKAENQATEESQTVTPTEYQVTLRRNYLEYDLRFMDTPGMRSTQGPKTDDHNLEEIIEAAGNLEEINGILLLVNGSESREDNTLEHAINQIRSMIPGDFANRIILLVSNVSIKPKIDVKKYFKEIPSEKIFYYNNGIFTLSPKDLEDPNIVLRAKDNFDRSLSQIDKILLLFDAMGPISANPFKKYSQLRKQMTQKLQKADKDSDFDCLQAEIFTDITEIKSICQDFNELFEIKKVISPLWTADLSLLESNSVEELISVFLQSKIFGKTNK